MKIHNSFDNIDGQSYLAVSNEIVIDVSQLFVDMTGYPADELLDKNIAYVFETLRVGPGIDMKNIDHEADYFLFTKSLEVKFIDMYVVEDGSREIYILSERPDSSLDIKFPFASRLCLDNHYGIGIYSVPDITLLKANDKHMSFFDEPCSTRENCIGKPIWEIMPHYNGSVYMDIWDSLIKTGQTCSMDEYEHTGLGREPSYWRLSLTPISEDGKLKYCVVMTEKVTEKVINQRRFKEQASAADAKGRQLEAVLEGLDGLIGLIDKDGNILRQSKVWAGYFSECDNINQHIDYNTKFYDLDGNAIQAEETAAFKVLKGERVKNYRMKFVSDDKEQYAVMSGIPVFNEDGGLDLGITFTHDITDLMNKEKQIKEQKEMFEVIVENMSDGLSIFDGSGKYILFNKAAREMFFPSYSYMKNTGDGFYQAEYFDLDGNTIPFDKLPANRVRNGEKFADMYMKVKFPDKVVHLNVSGTPIYGAENRFEMGILCSRDISRMIEYEERLEEQKELLEAILENMQEAILVFDKTGKYIVSNRAARELFNTEFDKVGDICKSIEFHDNDGNIVPFEETPNFRARCGESVKNKILVFNMGGKEIYSLMNGAPIFDEKGELLYGVVSGRDITDFMVSHKELKDTQKQLLQSEREKNEALEKTMEMKDEFLSIISHEFRTPLNVINTAIQTLSFVYADEMTDKVKEYMGTIRQNTNRQLRLINNLLDITRANAGRIKIHKKNIDIVFLTRAITESVYEFASRKGVRVTFVSKLKKKIIGIDDEKYERIILNLLSNAIKFTPEGKSIIVNLRSLKGSICVEVKDTGIGIPPNKIGLIFQKFGQVDSSLSRQAEGTGIGLSLVKKFVEASGGSVSVRSRVGRGTTFTVLLPNETVTEENDEKSKADLMDNRLIQTTHVEFSDIYF